MDTEERPRPEDFDHITWEIIGCAKKVARTLGPGFLEKVYENSLVIELRKRGLDVEQQVPLDVHYEDVVVGQFIVDVMVAGVVIIELKAVRAIEDGHKAQLINYLKATQTRVGLLLNFGSAPIGIKRLVF